MVLWCFVFSDIGTDFLHRCQLLVVQVLTSLALCLLL